MFGSGFAFVSVRSARDPKTVRVSLATKDGETFEDVEIFF